MTSNFLYISATHVALQPSQTYNSTKSCVLWFPGLCTGCSSYLPPSESGELVLLMQTFLQEAYPDYNQDRRLVPVLQ